MMLKQRLLGAFLAVCLIVSSIVLLMDMRPDLKLVSVAVMIASVIGLAMVFRQLRKKPVEPPAG